MGFISTTDKKKKKNRDQIKGKTLNFISWSQSLVLARVTKTECSLHRTEINFYRFQCLVLHPLLTQRYISQRGLRTTFLLLACVEKSCLHAHSQQGGIVLGLCSGVSCKFAQHDHLLWTAWWSSYVSLTGMPGAVGGFHLGDQGVIFFWHLIWPSCSGIFFFLLLFLTNRYHELKGTSYRSLFRGMWKLPGGRSTEPCDWLNIILKIK